MLMQKTRYSNHYFTELLSVGFQYVLGLLGEKGSGVADLETLFCIWSFKTACS